MRKIAIILFITAIAVFIGLNIVYYICGKQKRLLCLNEPCIIRNDNVNLTKSGHDYVCKQIKKSNIYNYRFTVEMDDPQGKLMPTTYAINLGGNESMDTTIFTSKVYENVVIRYIDSIDKIYCQRLKRTTFTGKKVNK